MKLLEQVRQTNASHHLLGRGDTVVVGVSGGPDSVCLLHVLVQLREELDLRLQVAHLHHGARGVDADGDAAFVVSLARSWGLPAVVERVNVPVLAREWRIAFEEAARRARYAYLSRVAAALGASKIAVGHNADDQAETVLMHFLRGAGMAGLRGMLHTTALADYRLLDAPAKGVGPPAPLEGRVAPASPSATGRLTAPAIIRPLLDVPRCGVEHYCRINRLASRFDRSNLDTTYFRNRLRHELIPILASFNPNVRSRLCHTAAIAAADYELLDQLSEKAWGDVVMPAGGKDRRIIDRAAWRELPTALQRATLRRGVYELRPRLRDLSFVQVEHARLVGLRGNPGAEATLPSHLALTVRHDSVALETRGAVGEVPDEPLLWCASPLSVSVPSITVIPRSGWALRANLLDTWDLDGIGSNPDRWTAYLDVDGIPDALVLRTRRPGDSFRPQGMGGHTVKLSAFLTNRKVPRNTRDHVPLLVAQGTILWVCGQRIAEDVAVRPETKQVLRLRFGRSAAGAGEGRTDASAS